VQPFQIAPHWRVKITRCQQIILNEEIKLTPTSSTCGCDLACGIQDRNLFIALPIAGPALLGGEKEGRDKEA
jgi:hypothetical protein